MINLRYHIVSLAAVLIALAAGVALGAGPLAHEEATPVGATDDAPEISAELAGFDAGFAALTAPDLVGGKLDGTSVVVFTTPGARDSEVASIVENLSDAGATVTGQIGLTAKLLAPSNRQFAEGVAAQSAGEAAGTGGAYEKVGAALGAAFLSASGAETGQAARTIRSAFAEGGLIDLAKDPDRLANLAVIVAGPKRAGSQGEGNVIAQFAASLDAAGTGLVIAGPVSSGDDGGIIAQVRGSEAASSVSTIDVTDSGTGRLATVLALIAESSGTSGSWGTSRAADGPVPR